MAEDFGPGGIHVEDQAIGFAGKDDGIGAGLEDFREFLFAVAQSRRCFFDVGHIAEDCQDAVFAINMQNPPGYQAGDDGVVFGADDDFVIVAFALRDKLGAIGVTLVQIAPHVDFQRRMADALVTGKTSYAGPTVVHVVDEAIRETGDNNTVRGGLECFREFFFAFAEGFGGEFGLGDVADHAVVNASAGIGVLCHVAAVADPDQAAVGLADAVFDNDRRTCA